MSTPPDQSRVWRSLALAMCGVALLNSLALVLDNIWHAVAINHAIMLPAALWALGARRREWLSLHVRAFAIGLFSAAPLLLATWGAIALAGLLNPCWREWLLQPTAMKDALAPALAIPLLVFPIIPGEEIVWRGAVMIPLIHRWGRAVGITAAALLFAAAHVSLGSVQILFAAVALGVVWGALTAWTRSLWPALICHLVWDLLMLYVVSMGVT